MTNQQLGEDQYGLETKLAITEVENGLLDSVSEDQILLRYLRIPSHKRALVESRRRRQKEIDRY